MSQQFQALVSEAAAAGALAAAAVSVEPMVVIGGGQRYVVESGVCGFASINIKPGNSAFANFLKKRGLARKSSYYGGVEVNVGGYGQSLTRKEAYAMAYARVLQKAGVQAYARSQID